MSAVRTSIAGSSARIRNEQKDWREGKGAASRQESSPTGRNMLPTDISGKEQRAHREVEDIRVDDQLKLKMGQGRG